MNQHDHPDDYCQSVYDLDGEPGTVSAALEHARGFLRRCSPGLDRQTGQDLELLVAELVTNAVRYAPGPLTLTMSCDEYIHVAVTDTSATAPTAREPDVAGGGGFGWHLITALADQVRVLLGPPYGKTISATIAGGARPHGRTARPGTP